MYRSRLTALLLVAALLSACSSAKPGATPRPGTAAGALSAKDLIAGGVEVVPDDRATARPAAKHLVLTQHQVDVMLGADGLLGSQVERLAPLPKGYVPMSFLVAAWLSDPASDRARAAAAGMGKQDWKRARDIAFPMGVITLFALDMVDAYPTPTPTPAGPAAAQSGEVHYTEARAPAPCSGAAKFLADAINGIFKVLNVTVPNTGVGPIDFVINVVDRVYKLALNIAQGVVDVVVKTVTGEVLDLLGKAIAALSLATTLAAYLQKQKLEVTVDPNQTYPFAIGDGPDVKGRATARAKDLSKDWPPALVDCAQGKLPELVAPGANYAWSVLYSGNGPTTITVPNPKGTLGSDKVARADFVTAREPAENTGPTINDFAYLTANVQSEALDDIVNVALPLVPALSSALLAAVPKPVRDAVSKEVARVLSPLVAELRNSLGGKVDGVFSLNGRTRVNVTYHWPASPSPKPAQSGAGGDFCKQYLSMAEWSQANRPPPLEPWAAEIERRLTAARPNAPAAIAADVDTMISVYHLAAGGAGPAQLANEMATRDFPGAGQRVGNYCHVDPNLFRVGG